MEKKKTRLHAFSLVEMLLVMAILVIFGAFGVGGFMGFRETMFVKENAEVIKQDILLAQQKSMLLERDTSDNWLYGIGIDLSSLTSTEADTGDNVSYKMFRWCSPYPDFGNPVTKSKLLGWDSTQNIGVNVTPVLGVSTTDKESLMALEYWVPTPEDPIPDDVDSCYGIIRYCPEEPFNCTEARLSWCATYCSYATCTASCVADYSLCDTEDVTPPPTEDDIPVVTFKNGYLPIDSYTSSCTLGSTSLVEITGGAADQFVDAGTIQLLGTTPVQYVVFEAVTGKAFLYDATGKPVNYTSAAPNLYYNGSTVLDIAILRDRSTKFDLISIYPSSGTVIHHVYTDADKAPASATSGIITVNGQKYNRFGVFDDISSYRDYE